MGAVDLDVFRAGLVAPNSAIVNHVASFDAHVVSTWALWVLMLLGPALLLLVLPIREGRFV